MGYPAVGTIQTPADVAALRAERQATIDAEAAAKAALDSFAAKKSKSAAVGTVRAQRADYWEDAGGRWLSVEGTTTQASVTNPCPVVNNRLQCSYTGPQLVASWHDGQGQQLGRGDLQAYLDTDVTPVAPYLYHVTRFRLGDATTVGTPMPSFIRIAAPNGDVAQLAVKKWVGNGPRRLGRVHPGLQHALRGPAGGLRHDGVARCAVPGRLAGLRPAEQDDGLPAQGPDGSGHRDPYTGETATPAPADQARAVVLTSLDWGQLGGNDITAQIVNPGANDSPLSVSVTGKAIKVSAATDASGAITSTAAQVVAAISANPDGAKLVSASVYRTNAGAGVVTAQAAPSALSDWLKAPASYPRGPQTVKMLRIGKVRDGSKVGVFIYCQEHAREWGTPLVCLETAQRLLKNYGTDPETTSLVDNLDIFIIPTINADGAAYSMYDNNVQRRTWSTTARRSRRATTSRTPATAGGGPQSQLQRRLLLRRQPGRVEQLYERHLRRPVRALRAGGPQRGLCADDVPEHQVRDEHALQRRLLHVAPGRVQAHHP